MLQPWLQPETRWRRSTSRRSRGRSSGGPARTRRSALGGSDAFGHPGRVSRVPSDPAPHAPRSARAPLTLRPTQASALLQPGRAGCRGGRGARWARRGRHVLHGIGSVASVGPKGRQVASAGRLCRHRCCAEPADRPVLARAGGFAGAGSCRHRRPWGRRHLPRRHQLSALLVARASIGAPTSTSLPCPPARGVAP